MGIPLQIECKVSCEVAVNLMPFGFKGSTQKRVLLDVYFRLIRLRAALLNNYKKKIEYLALCVNFQTVCMYFRCHFRFPGPFIVLRNYFERK